MFFPNNSGAIFRNYMYINDIDTLKLNCTIVLGKDTWEAIFINFLLFLENPVSHNTAHLFIIEWFCSQKLLRKIDKFGHFLLNYFCLKEIWPNLWLQLSWFVSAMISNIVLVWKEHKNDFITMHQVILFYFNYHIIFNFFLCGYQDNLSV